MRGFRSLCSGVMLFLVGALLSVVLVVAAAPRFELAVVPLAPQINGKFTQHVGSDVDVLWHFDRLALRVGASYQWLSTESSLNAELAGAMRIESQQAASLLWTWGLHAGVELAPLDVELKVREGTVHAEAFVGVGAGAAGFRLTLAHASGGRPATYGDVGARLIGVATIGLRVHIGQRVVLHFELRDAFASASVETINGCNAADLAPPGDPVRTPDPSRSPSCNWVGPPFEPLDRDSLSIARRSLFEPPVSDVLHLITLRVGAGVEL